MVRALALVMRMMGSGCLGMGNDLCAKNTIITIYSFLSSIVSVRQFSQSQDVRQGRK